MEANSAGKGMMPVLWLQLPGYLPCEATSRSNLKMSMTHPRLIANCHRLHCPAGEQSVTISVRTLPQRSQLYPSHLSSREKLFFSQTMMPKQVSVGTYRGHTEEECGLKCLPVRAITTSCKDVMVPSKGAHHCSMPTSAELKTRNEKSKERSLEILRRIIAKNALE